ncbi:MAG TPA: hypothetical protein VET48_14390, partial [Steroidobacteraceae bacterium]|nr:hypothetical protein [Steroidobacteraceae bacterium]
KNKAAFNTNYTNDVPGGSLSFSGSYIWRDKQFGSVFNRPFTEAPSWKQTDLRVQYKTLQDHLTLIVFGKNVFDQIGYIGGAGGVQQTNATGTVVGYVKNFQIVPPRIIGGEIQYKF